MSLHPRLARTSARTFAAYRRRFIAFAAIALLILQPTLLASSAANAQSSTPLVAGASSTIFINEIHYDNIGNDSGEFVEIAGPSGTDLSVYSIVLYNGSGGASYRTDALSGTIPAQQGGYGTASISYAANGIQNGDPDGVALVNTATNTVIQFLSYEGTFTATSGAASGMTSTTIGVAESNSTTAVGASLQLQGSGTTYGDFTWSPSPIANTINAPNTNQTFTGGGSGGAPTISINNPSVTEGNSGTTTATFTVSLSAPAPTGGVTFDIATQDNTATTTDNDYVARSLTGQTIAAGSQTYTFDVTVNGDTTQEPNETFFVNVTNVSGATPQSVTGTGTITNDDAPASTTPINQLQGSGLTSPCTQSGSSCFNVDVSTRGIVTLLRTTNGGAGFFIQSTAADDDGNAATSEGIFVFTNAAPTVAVGNSVTVTGRVTERFSNTTLTPASGGIVVTSTGNAPPAPVTLTSTILNPAGTTTQLEPYEGMRLSAASLTTVSPCDAFGDFYTVLTGTPRPLREPGIPVSQTPPPAESGAGSNRPRFDENPERIIVDSNGRADVTTPEVVTSFVTLTNTTGVLDFAFSQYRLIAEATLTRGANFASRPVRAATANEFTVASFNIENFNTGATCNTQCQKAALAIRNVLRLPDVIGLQEIFNLTSLQTLATQINAATPTGEQNPQYEARLMESPGDQEVAFLVKRARVNILSVMQEGSGVTFVNPNNGQTELANDRPPLVLRATVATPAGSTLPVTVISNHLRSFIDIDVEPEGARVRAKRRAQAEYLAGLIQSFQQAGENVVSVGDYNAYPFNDGYVDVIGTIKGDPAPADQVTLTTRDLVDPNLFNTIDSLASAERYSFVFEGNAQALDQIIINERIRTNFRELQYARFDADFPDAFSADATRPERVSDHDSPVAYFMLTPPLIISEFRLRGAQGSSDEFIEIYNNSATAFTVTPTDNSNGYALVASDGTTRFVIPSGTVIPALGHYLGVNSTDYSLGAHPSGNNGATATTATGDIAYTTGIGDNAGIALFSTDNPANFTLANRLDAVGSTSEANTLYKEGAGYPALTPFSLEYSFFRKVSGAGSTSVTETPRGTLGLPQDTGDNAADFLFADTEATNAGAGERLGAPGPENLTSPIIRNGFMPILVFDRMVAQSSPPNRVRDSTTGPAATSTRGTIEFRKRIVNNTGFAVTRLRFRIIDLSTLLTPTGIADLRAITSADVANVTSTDPDTCQAATGSATTPCQVTVTGTTLETPPTQPNGGGYNSALGVGTIDLASPLAPGASVNVRLLFGVQQTGQFKFFFNVEALPGR